MYSIPNIRISSPARSTPTSCLLLPPPSDDTPEARHLRDERAMTAVAHLLPENAAEAEVAVLVVAAQFPAREALRAASQPGLEPDQTRRYTAQAASMMPQADGSSRTLLRMQAERQNAETAMRPAAMERAGYWFRSASPEPNLTLDQATMQPPYPCGRSLPRTSSGEAGRGARPIPGLDPGTRPAAERTAEPEERRDGSHRHGRRPAGYPRLLRVY